MTYTAAEKVSAAVKTLVLDHPFWGALALRLECVEDPSCDTAWTNSIQMGYNADFILSLPQPEVVGLVAHEVGHCILKHCFRRPSWAMDDFLWNCACDYALNPELIGAGFKLPADGLFDADFAGRSAEFIYRRLADQDDDGEGPVGPVGDEPTDEDGEGKNVKGRIEDENDDAERTVSTADDDENDDEEEDEEDKNELSGDDDEQPQQPKRQAPAGEVRNAPPTAAEDATEGEEEWADAVKDAALMVDRMDGLGDATTRVVDAATAAKVDWRNELHRFAEEIAAEDYTMEWPDERFLSEDLYLPSMASEGMGHLVVVIDTSGSVDKVTLRQYEAEQQLINDVCQPERITIIYCDFEICGVETYERGEPITLKGSGGRWTDFRPPFVWVDEQMTDRPAAMIYLTDMYGTFPDAAPDYPVLWASTSHVGHAPFGEVIKVGD